MTPEEESAQQSIDRSQQVTTRLTQLVAEAIQVRFDAWGDFEALVAIDPDNGPAEALAAFYEVRGRADRMDRIVSDVTRVRGIVRRQREAASFSANEAYNTATRDNAANRTREFVTARERHADASLDSFNERRAKFEADTLMDVADESYELVRGFSFQLGARSKELQAMLHALQFLSSLER